jgi:glycosyltransferase involved in cell wall biosynthesis
VAYSSSLKGIEFVTRWLQTVGEVCLDGGKFGFFLRSSRSGPARRRFCNGRRSSGLVKDAQSSQIRVGNGGHIGGAGMPVEHDPTRPHGVEKKTHRKFIIVAQGARDYYQTALALNEVGALALLVTDFYTPDLLRNFLNKRFHRDLPSTKTISIYPTVVLGAIIKSDKYGKARRTFVDGFLGFVGAILTYLGSGRAIVYSYHIEGFVAFYRLIKRRPVELICFQVHPTPWYIRSLVRADAEAFARLRGIEFAPELEASYSPEEVASYLAAIQFCDKVICASSVTRRSLNSNAAELPPTLIVPYGSKLEGFSRQPEPMSTKSDKIKLVTVGQVTQRKGLHWAFHAMSCIEPEIQGRFEWTIVTNSTDENIMRLAPNNVQVVNGLSDMDLARVLRSSDLFVMPSIIEGFGLVYIESLSLGTPVIYTPETGMMDICESGKHGFEVRCSSSADIERIFRQIAMNPESIRNLRANCIELATRFTWEHFRKGVRDAVFGA